MSPAPVPAPPGHTASRGRPASAQAADVLIPFTGAAHVHREPISVDSFVPGAAARVIPQPVNVTAYGYLKNVIVDVQWTGGVAGTLAADAPWNFFQAVWLQDVNGAYIQFPVDGFAMLQENIYGGYAGPRPDPRLSPVFASSATAGRFIFRVPVEINSRTAMGSLANQNAAEEYKFGYTTNPSTVIWSAAPTTVPTFTVRTYLEAWSQPDDYDLFQRRQATAPPRHGTAQYWTVFTPQVVVGNNQTPITRMGNIIRALVAIARDGTGARNDAVFPDPFQLMWDSKQLLSESQALRLHLTAESLPVSITRDTGVFVFAFNTINKGSVGQDDPDLWLPTVQATRMELDGSSATAGTIQFLVNDIAPAEVNPQRRFIESAQTGQLAHPDLVAA